MMNRDGIPEFVYSITLDVLCSKTRTRKEDGIDPVAEISLQSISLQGQVKFNNWTSRRYGRDRLAHWTLVHWTLAHWKLVH
jgi:hypothetical protein